MDGARETSRAAAAMKTERSSLRQLTLPPSAAPLAALLCSALLLEGGRRRRDSLTKAGSLERHSAASQHVADYRHQDPKSISHKETDAPPQDVEPEGRRRGGRRGEPAAPHL